jgi:histidinol-phosphate phosphatase family protein
VGDSRQHAPSARRPAVFLDRDGTLIADRHYLADADQVELLPGIAPAVARLNRAGVPVIVVTNQSGIGRGYFTSADYDRVAARVEALLAMEGARLDATYLCPHAPSDDTPCACRKPGLLLFERAIVDHGLDAKRSFFVGDRWRDVVPARAFGGRGILVPGADTPEADRELAAREAEVAPSLSVAIDRVLAVVGASAA